MVAHMSTAYKIVHQLAPLARHFNSPDFDKALDLLCQELPFQVLIFDQSHEHNGWVIPPHYQVTEAKIIYQGEIIYDGLHHPLAVPCHAASFQGKVDLATLRKHLFFDSRFSEAIPYHFRYSYRPWERDWGFCVPSLFYDSLEEGEYEIVLQVAEGKKELKVLTQTIGGSSGLEFAFIAHLDHPGMANDDLAGCAVGVELFQHLRKKNLKHTYHLFLVQEIIGSQLLLNSFPQFRNIQEAIFLEMLGVDQELALQRASTSPTANEIAIEMILSQKKMPFRVADFRKVICNDEIVFESFGIPTASLSRFPYPQYHSSLDSIDIINPTRLSESVQILLDLVDWHEKDLYFKKILPGLPCLSNPQFDLYVDPGQIAFAGNQGRPNLYPLMEEISLSQSPKSVAVLAQRLHLDIPPVCKYLRKCADKGVIKII